MALQLLDFRRARLSAGPAATDGTMTGQGSAVPVDQVWLVTRVVVSTSGQQCRVDLYAADPGTADPTGQQLVDNTLTGSLDIGEYPRGLLLLTGEALTAFWTGAAPGATGQVVYQYEVYAQAAGGGQTPDQYAAVKSLLRGGR